MASESWLLFDCSTRVEVHVHFCSVPVGKHSRADVTTYHLNFAVDLVEMESSS